MRQRIKNSIGVWAFGANATRFVPDGYHQDLKILPMEDKIDLICQKLGDIVDGLELHYPGEINGDNINQIKNRLITGIDIYCIPLGFHCMEEFIHGSFINPDNEKRNLAIRLAKEAIDMCAEEKSHLIIWPGGEGYNYPFQVDYAWIWDRFTDGIAQVMAYANEKNVTVFLEHKHGEPAMKILMRNIGMTLFTIEKVKQKGVNTENLLVNMDWQHLIMNGEHLPEYAALLLAEKKMGHHHGNSGWGTFDDDNIPGTSNFMDILGLAKVLQNSTYGNNGERIGFDLFPYTENVFDAVRQSILQWEFIFELASRIETGPLLKAQRQKDAIQCYRLVYKALGMNEKEILKRFQQ